MMDCWGRKFVKAAVLSKGATTGSANRSGLWSGDTLSRCQAPLTTRCPLDDFVSPTFTLTGTSHSLFDSMGLLSSPSGAYTPLPKSASELIAPPDPRTRLRTLGLTLAAFLLVVLPLLWTHPGVSIARVAVEEEAPTSPDAKGFCSDATSLSVEAPKRNVWKNLDVQEAAQVRKWLFEEEQGLNLTKSGEAKTSDNTVFIIEAHRPAKKDALRYLDDGAAAPPKFAHAVIHHASRTPPVIVDYLVGPLPISQETTMRPLAENYATPEIPLTARAYQLADANGLGSFVHRVFGPLGELTMDLFGVRADGYANDTLTAGGSSPVSFDGEWRRMWMPMKLNVPGSYLHSLDFYIYVDMTSLDWEDWKVLTWVYNHQVFKSVEALVAAWKDGTLVRSQKVRLNDTDWATRTPKGVKRDLDHLAGPRSVMFDGPRFRADLEEDYFTWMGWSMYTSFERDMGLSLWSISFRDERIVYELTPQEAMAQYSGNDPGQSHTVWLDRSFGMGALVKELIAGYDCPSHALYLPATVHTSMGSTTRPNAICVFEHQKSLPLSRHTGEGKNEMGAVKGYELIVRSISTVGNYDYIFDYTFMLDGTMEIRFSASGYLQGNYWDPSRDGFGTRIRETSAGALHDHVLNYKVDLDVAGTANTISSVSLEVQEIEQPWFDDDWGTTNIQQAIVKRKHLNESTTKFENPKNGEGLLVISNEDAKNAWGAPRAYAIHAGVSNIHLTNLNNKRTLKNVQWAKGHAFATRAKDSEPYSSSAWNMNLPGRPPVDFDSFFDDESLDQEDLVLWLNLGTHHVPRAEDSPHTLTNVATSYLLLIPFNYNDYDVSMEAQNAIVINPNSNSWESTGHIDPGYCLPKRLPAFNYTGLIGFKEDGTRSSPGEVREFRVDAHAMHDFRAKLPV